MPKSTKEVAELVSQIWATAFAQNPELSELAVEIDDITVTFRVADEQPQLRRRRKAQEKNVEKDLQTLATLIKDAKASRASKGFVRTSWIRNSNQSRASFFRKLRLLPTPIQNAYNSLS